MKPPAKRCALYTRKSSDEGLDQAFNSLDAQREACEAYVKSQASEGWRALDQHYDDGGFSGGSIERPAIRRLMADIAAGRIDVIVVYKIDRLTRSLADFARLVELFDAHGVSFVSVTQAFNTTTSMGRLTLNVLLSFAQFEREVTGERIRDKIAASKAKGMWMGGVPPLGYDIPVSTDRILIVNEAEAQTVRLIFKAYLELGSVHVLVQWLADHGVVSKARIMRSGKQTGGLPFSRGALFHLLRNRVYTGRIVHRDTEFPGLHAAIIDEVLFGQVKSRLDAQARRHNAKRDHIVRAPLAGKLFDADGQPLTPTFSRGCKGKIYRYYVAAELQQGQSARGSNVISRISAPALEAKITMILARFLSECRDPLAALHRAEIYPHSLHLMFPASNLSALEQRLGVGEHVSQTREDRKMVRLTVPVSMRLRGGRTRIVAGTSDPARHDVVLIKALRRAHTLVASERSGLPKLEVAPASPYLRRLVRLAFLAPDLQSDILAGRQPATLTLEQMLNVDLAPDWAQQRSDLGWAA